MHQNDDIVNSNHRLSQPWWTRSSIRGLYKKDGFVATSQPVATEAGLHIIRQGGNAADASIATVAALNVIEPCCCGLGGDAFALIYDNARKEVKGMNASGRSARTLTLEVLEKHHGLNGHQELEAFPPASPHTVTVPGAIAGYCEFLERFGSGRFTLTHLLQPAIELAEEGFLVHNWTAGAWKRSEHFLLRGENGSELLHTRRYVDAKDTGEKSRAPRECIRNSQHPDVMTNPNLANTLKKIAEFGKDGFYKGEVGEAIVDIVQKAGGVLSMRDLSDYCDNVDGLGVSFDEPISVNYKGVDVWEIPPNGQGITALIALNILQEYDRIREEEGAGVNSREQNANQDSFNPYNDRYAKTHVMIEALRLAFADAEAYVCDWSNNGGSSKNTNYESVCKRLLSTEYAKECAKLIQENKIIPPGNPKAGLPENCSCTTQFVVVDTDGNAVSFIQSNYAGFGTNLVPKNCGFTLQNRGANFSVKRGHRNVLEPLKRPYHTIIPGMATVRGKRSNDERENDKQDVNQDSCHQLYATFGCMGGYMQPQGHLQLLVNLIDYSFDPQEAIDFPRFCIRACENLPPGADGGRVVTDVERFFLDGDCVTFVDGKKSGSSSTESVFSALTRKGHALEVVDGFDRSAFGRAQIVKKQGDRVLIAGSESRCDGCAFFTRRTC